CLRHWKTSSPSQRRSCCATRYPHMLVTSASHSTTAPFTHAFTSQETEDDVDDMQSYRGDFKSITDEHHQPLPHEVDWDVPQGDLQPHQPLHTTVSRARRSAG